MNILYDMQPRHKDPAYEAFVAQVKVYHKFFGTGQNIFIVTWRKHGRS